MARLLDKEKARKLRADGKSYSEIRSSLHVSKGTLSDWLNDMPLSSQQIRQLRDLNPRRIEKFRQTMRDKRDERLNQTYVRAKRDIGKVSKREAFIAGVYLYWAEGTKAARGRVEIANTDPSVIKAFLQWLLMMKVPLERIRVRLQLYKDMDIKAETKFWSDTLGVPALHFRKPAIKESSLSGLSRKRGHGHGTCDLIFDNMPMWEYITMALKYIREWHIRS